ncbi:nucleoside hydrolase, partial [Enterococcus sp. S181_ASV_20]|nr:nucleoside hydrolase [Enterococcus sp. S181_ASV_20]
QMCIRDRSFDYYSANQAEYLVKQVNLYPNEITILATGALTNLSEALRIDPNFFKKVQEVVLMGGTIEPLKVNHRSVSYTHLTLPTKLA